MEINGYPFQPRYRVMILDTGDNIDCCSLQALYKNKQGKWDVGAVKHGMIGFDSYPQISPLYSASIVTDVKEDEEILLELKEYVN